MRRHMLLEMARMSTEDGLTMTLHIGVRRGHHGPSAARFGPDTGHDIPLRGDFTDPLRPLLERYGTHPNLNLVLFTLDETVFSRELAPLAGFYPSVSSGHRGGSWTPPTRCGAGARQSPTPPASPGHRASSMTLARSAPSRRAMTCPAVWTAATSPSSSPNTGST